MKGPETSDPAQLASGQPSPPKSSSPTISGPPSLEESKFCYYGLPSRPFLVARMTMAPWYPPTGIEAYATPKELRPIGNHNGLKNIWENGFLDKLKAFLDEQRVKWTSIDIVRIAHAGDSHAPAIIWLGVMPKSLSGDRGVEVADKYPTADLRIPLTATLGQPISTLAAPWTEGTLGFLIQKGGDRSKLFGVTAAHVLDNQSKEYSKVYHREITSQPFHKVTLLGEASYRQLMDEIKVEIDGKRILIDLQERGFKAVGDNTTKKAEAERAHAEDILKNEIKAMETLQDFQKEARTHWAKPENRILGFTLLSPPIAPGAMPPDGFAEDWAIIELDLDKFDSDNFEGNAIDPGTEISPNAFTTMMYPNPGSPSGFVYPTDRLLRIRGRISLKEMRAPTLLDQNGDPCLIVIKRGRTTGITIGRANELSSFTRHVGDDGTTQDSKEWSILPRNSKSGPFSAKGDSGAAIVDGKGRLDGIVSAGTSYSENTDITYATPIEPLLESFQKHGFGKANINPELPA